MDNWLRDLREMAELLEAEAQGRPFDRHHASRLAIHLADAYPDIRDTMRQASVRLRNGGH